MFPLMTLAVLVTTYSLVGIVAVWGGLGRGPWFARVAAVLVFLSVWLASPEYGIWVALLVQSTIVIAALLLVRSFRSGAEASIPGKSAGSPAGRAWPKFTLTDLFLLMLVAGVVLAILVRVAPSMHSQWLKSVVPGVVFAIITLTASWAASARRKLWVRLATLAVFFPTCLIGAWLWLARAARSRLGRAAAATSLLLIATPPSAFYAWLIAPRFLELPAPLENNGLDDLLLAAEKVTNPAVDVNALDDDALAAYLDQHRDALELARAGLARPCQIELPAEGPLVEQTSIDRSSSLRHLARVLAADGRLQLLAGHPRDAADRCLEAIQLGEAMTHGGTISDAMFGAACQMTGLDGLLRILPQLDAAACRELGARLAKLEERQDTFEQIADREMVYFKKYRPWGERWTLSQVPELFEQSRRVSATSFNKGLARLRLFRCHLALREYWLAHAAYPEKLLELTPDMLAELPPDPFSGRNLVYRRLPDGYQLYSVGPDGVDDDGRALSPGVSPVQAKDDIALDLAVSPERESPPAESAAPEPTE